MTDWTRLALAIIGTALVAAWVIRRQEAATMRMLDRAAEINELERQFRMS